MPQQLQVGGRAFRRLELYGNALFSKSFRVALTKCVLSALGRTGGEQYTPGWIGVQPPIGKHQQRGGKRDKKTNGNDQIAHRQQGVTQFLGHGLNHSMLQPTPNAQRPTPNAQRPTAN